MNATRSTTAPNPAPRATETPIVGTTHDPMEQEAHRISEAVMRATWTASSTGSISRDRPIDSGSANAQRTSATPQGSGRPLKPTTRKFMERRLGHDFSKVRIHDDAHASASAHAIQARAYTIGNQVVADPGAIRDERPEGFPVLAHELVHVVQQSDAVEGARFPIRRTGFFQSIARLFGGGTFSEEELTAYLAGLEGTGEIEDEYDSDNKANAVVEQELHRSQPLSVRILLIREMLSGHLGRGEQQSILTILNDADAGERERILEEVEPAELRRRFRGDRSNQLNLLLRDVTRGRSASVGTEWRIAYGTRGAESLRRSDETLNLVSMVAEPSPAASAHESPPGPIPIIAEPRTLTGSGAPQTIASNVSHPRDMGGIGYLTFNIGGTILGANTDRSAPYAPVTRDNHRATAHLQVNFGSERRGSRTINAGGSTTTSVTHTTGDSDTSSVESTASASAGRSDTTTTGVEGTASRTTGTDIGIEHGGSHGTETTDTRTTETTVSFGGTLSQELRGDARLTAGAQVSGALLGTLLGLAGPEGVALWELLNALGAFDDTHLTLGLEGGGGFTLRGELHGEVARRWTTSHSDTTTDERSATVRAGGSRSDESSVSVRGEDSGTTNTEVGGSVTGGSSHTHSTDTAATGGATIESSLSISEDTLVPVIDDAGLEIRVE